MKLLVDYDNVLKEYRRRGLLFVIDKILTSLGDEELLKLTPPRVRIRLYGGWYREKILTRSAQTLSAEIASLFPTHRIALKDGRRAVINVFVELAYSLEIEPQRHLWFTYRERRSLGLSCEHPNSIGCREHDCPLVQVHETFLQNKCPEPQCNVPLDKILYKGEQKLVDTMLTSDLIHLALRGEKKICVVTEDDDLYPGIRSAQLCGANIIHLNPKGKPPRPGKYAVDIGRTYFFGSF